MGDFIAVAGQGFTASPAVADGLLVVGSVDGTLFAFGAKPRG